MQKVVILGAAGRDFHNFNLLYRDRSDVQVVAFSATQIPEIDGRVYPASLAGRHYPDGIPIVDEETVDALIADEGVERAVFAYSDVDDAYVMALAQRIAVAGADFVLMAPQHTMLTSSKPVIAVTAVRTGVGKSQTTRFLASRLATMGVQAVAVRHPMPYGDLAAQAVQRFASLEDVDAADCTIEEREEYEPYIAHGMPVYAGVDYEAILRQAEQEADVILWDGGNNDTPFITPNLHITLLDPHRVGDELRYYPGRSNVLMADVLVVNKVRTAEPGDVEQVIANARGINGSASVMRCASAIFVEHPNQVRGKRVLVVEDGPTLTHGGMSYGAGSIAARNLGASMVDPRPYAVGSVADVYQRFRHLGPVLPAMGYNHRQLAELAETIRNTPCDLVLSGTPINLSRLVSVETPIVDVRYELEELDPGALQRAVAACLARFHGGAAE